MEQVVSLDTLYKRSENVVSRLIAGEAVLVPLSQNMGSMDSIYTLNKTAAAAWELFDGKTSLCRVCERIVERFDVMNAEAAQDLVELAEDLYRIGLVERV